MKKAACARNCFLQAMRTCQTTMPAQDTDTDKSPCGRQLAGDFSAQTQNICGFSGLFANGLPQALYVPSLSGITP
ncbi:hypothetical protein PSCICL_33860 [Pseudomonas cichorii]|nr:hypothetical protein PSCICL_33860 [Pseudomonas cichorii]